MIDDWFIIAGAFFSSFFYFRFTVCFLSYLKLFYELNSRSYNKKKMEKKSNI